MNIAVLGFPGAGKTTILSTLTDGRYEDFSRTSSIVAEIGLVGLVFLQIYDVQFQDYEKDSLILSLSHCRGLIFVVDMTEALHLVRAARFIEGLMSNYVLHKHSLLVMATKPNEYLSLTPSDVSRTLRLDKIWGRPVRLIIVESNDKAACEAGVNWVVRSL